MMEEQRKAVWPTTINGQSLSGSTGTMETQLPSIQVSKRLSGAGSKSATLHKLHFCSSSDAVIKQFSIFLF
jgi:hypothetical protein